MVGLTDPERDEETDLDASEPPGLDGADPKGPDLDGAADRVALGGAPLDEGAPPLDVEGVVRWREDEDGPLVEWASLRVSALVR